MQINKAQELIINTYINTLKQYPFDTDFCTAAKVLENVKIPRHVNTKKENISLFVHLFVT